MDHSFSGEVVFNGRRYRFVRPAMRRRDPSADVYRNSNGEPVSYEYVLDLPGPKRPRLATSAEDIRRLLREVRARDDDDDDVAAQTECAVCLQDYAAGEALSGAMPVCAHAFHHGCITEWLGRNAVCPLCRRKLKQEEEEVQVPEEEDEVDENGVSRRNWRRVPLTAADYDWGTWSSAAGEFHHRID